MECHYKVLGIELNAESDAIKKAYRKAALKYHPDKNLHCLDEATERFRLVQAAYDVLSDPQERAWYDRHREEILHRKKYENYKDNSLDLWEFFSPSAYKGFGDEEKGFYAVYRDVFTKIDAEDEPFRSDDSDNEALPTFGDSKSDYNEVVHVFYSSWQAYCTHLSFVWENQYDAKEAPNRRVARIVEKENKKERGKHKKQRNETVRQLVAFVRKRDPRVKAHKLELEKTASEKAQRAEEHRASLLMERVEEAARYDEANKEEMIKHHEKLDELESMMKDEFGFSSSEDDDGDFEKDEDGDEVEEEYKDELFCVACNKLFKSEMGLRNHQKSKKHKESMNRLREEMKNEDSAKMAENEVDDDGETYFKTEDESKNNTKLSKKQKKQKRQQQKLLDNSMAADPINVDVLSSETIDQEPAESKSISCDNNGQLAEAQDKSNEDAPLECVSSQSGSHAVDANTATGSMDTVDHIAVTTDCPLENTASSRKKAKQKKQKQPQNQTSDLNSEPLGCGKCSRTFSSRNKLFQHLKQTGHSLPLENGNPILKRKEKRTRK